MSEAAVKKMMIKAVQKNPQKRKKAQLRAGL
jgi:hypothetical protein